MVRFFFVGRFFFMWRYGTLILLCGTLWGVPSLWDVTLWNIYSSLWDVPYLWDVMGRLFFMGRSFFVGRYGTLHLLCGTLWCVPSLWHVMGRLFLMGRSFIVGRNGTSLLYGTFLHCGTYFLCGRLSLRDFFSLCGAFFFEQVLSFLYGFLQIYNSMVKYRSKLVHAFSIQSKPQWCSGQIK